MRKAAVIAGGALAASLVVLVLWQGRVAEAQPWSDAEIALLRSISLESLPPLPPDPSNRVADNAEAAAFGQELFFDSRFSANGGISCATCHQPVRQFTDGLAKGQAIGTSKRNTPGIIGTAYSPWLYWDGRRDSQWAQALSPLEDPNEHGSNRLQVVRQIAGDSAYRRQYESIFGPMPVMDDAARFPAVNGPPQGPGWNAAWTSMTEEDRDSINRVFANVGKAIAAFERTLRPTPSQFDAYVTAVASGEAQDGGQLLDQEAIKGLRLFIGEANCLQCHNGPLLTNNEFHNTGALSAPGETPDIGRAGGVRLALSDPFNCLGDYSDDSSKSCDELTFVRTGPELIGAVRTPSLRNVGMTAPYMHKGQIATIADVLDHYNRAPDAMVGHNEADPLELSTRQLGQLESFLQSLSSPAYEF